MKQYYDLEGGTLRKNTAFAYLQEGSENQVVDLESLVVNNHLPLDLELVSVKLIKGKIEVTRSLDSVEHLWLDYQPNEMAWPLMSERMASIVEKHKSGQEGLEWVSTLIRAGSEERIYKVPKFSKELDVLDEALTKIDEDGFFSIPTFSLAKVSQFAIFPYRNLGWKITSTLAVNGELMNALKKAKLSGVAFSPVRMA